MKNKTLHTVPLFLLEIYFVLFTALAFSPVDRRTWLVENATVWIILAVIITLYVRGIRFSNTSYILMSVLIYLHTIGGHYTFAHVPFEWVTNFFGFERNNFDRLAHFTVGFYAFPIAEWLYRKRLVAHRFLLYTYPVFAIATIAMSYELIEWVYATSSDPAAGAAYLGSQGDQWDAQKDMFADTLGAIVAVVFFGFLHRKRMHKK